MIAPPAYGFIEVPFMRIALIDPPKLATSFKDLPNLAITVYSTETAESIMLYMQKVTIEGIDSYNLNDELAKNLLVPAMEKCLASPEVVEKHGHLVLGVNDAFKQKAASALYSKLMAWREGKPNYSMLTGSGYNGKLGHRLTLQMGRECKANFVRMQDAPNPDTGGFEFSGSAQLFGKLVRVTVSHNEFTKTNLPGRPQWRDALLTRMLDFDAMQEEVRQRIDLEFAGLHDAGFIDDIKFQPLIKR